MKEYKYFVNETEYETMFEAEVAVSAYVEAAYADESYYDGDYGDDLFNEYENPIRVLDEDGTIYGYSEFLLLKAEGKL